MTLKIGKIRFKNNLALAPMAGITDLGFRLLCRKYGAGLAYTEMISAQSIVHGAKKINNLTMTCKKDSPLAVQIFGSDASVMAKAASIIEPFADIIDINLGCPAPKISRQNAGAGALNNLLNVQKILSRVRDAVSVPLIVKTRLGLSEKKTTVFDLIKICENIGLDAICVHARTLSQGFGGKADIDALAKIRQKTNMAFIANGDINSGQSALAMIKKTKCDAVMIGRAAIGNPVIFRQIDYFLKGKTFSGVPDKIYLFKEYISLSEKYHALDSLDKNRMRQQALYFAKSMHGARQLRLELSKAKNTKEILNIFCKKSVL